MEGPEHPVSAVLHRWEPSGEPLSTGIWPHRATKAFDFCGLAVIGPQSATSADGEDLVRIEGVRGSNPLSSTQVKARFRSWNRVFLILVRQQSAATAFRRPA